MLARDGRISPVRQQQTANAGLAVFVVVFLVYMLRTPLGGSTQALFHDYYTFPLVMGIAYVGLLLTVVLRPGPAVGRLCPSGPWRGRSSPRSGDRRSRHSRPPSLVR